MEGMPEEGRLGWILKTIKSLSEKERYGERHLLHYYHLWRTPESPTQNRVILGTGMSQTQTGLSKGFTLCWEGEARKMDKIWVKEMGKTMNTQRMLEEGEGKERCLGLVSKNWSLWVLGVLGTMGKSGLIQIGTKFLNTTGEAPVPEGRSPDPSPRTGLVRWREHHLFSLIHSYSLSLCLSLSPSSSHLSSLLPYPSCSFFSSSSSLHSSSSSKPQNILDPDLTA